MLDKIGNCRVVAEIASGGMAVVYKAVQESLNRTVAVKALKSDVATDSQFAIRFEREALSLAHLQHENIVSVYDFYKEGGSLFIVLEYVEGIDLYDLLDRCGRLPYDVAAIVALQVARALDYAHYRGIVHRDIKPANVMLSREGGVKLMDFGIARDPSFGDLTQTGTGLGTPSYMSPEQILGDKLDFRSDLFSLGIVLYQMCTGRKPFLEDEFHSVMHKIRLERYPSPRRLNPEVPRELERILARCMQKAPAHRWRSTQDLVLALERFLSRRVDINYHARLVQFLRSVDVVTAEAAAPFLRGTTSPALARATTRRLVHRAAAVLGLITAGVALTVGLIHVAPVGAGSDAVHAAVLSARSHGVLRVVAHPWAEVWVDGTPRGVTPLAAPLALPAGRHVIELRHPSLTTVTRTVETHPGEQAAPLVVHLGGRRGAPRPVVPPRPRSPSPAGPPRIEHAVRRGDTPELLAAEYYGRRDLAPLVLLGNGLERPRPRPRPLRPGDKLVIPTAWKYRIVEGDMLGALALRYLGDVRRAAFLAEVNQIPLDGTLTVGNELVIPGHVEHVASARTSFAELAATAYLDSSKAALLRRYNFRPAGEPVLPGDGLVLPVVDVFARLPEDPEAERRARRQREAEQRVKEALPKADEAWRQGDYAAARTALAAIETASLDATTAAEVAFVLGAAHVALGDGAAATRAFTEARARRPDLAARRDEHPPKLCDAWRAAGGRVIDQ